MPGRSSLVRAAAAVAVLVTSLSGCNPAPRNSGQPTIVATTDVWASVAEAVVDDHAKVETLITGTQTDPHSFQVTPTAAAHVQDASLVVYNGGGYDPFIDSLLGNGQPRVNAYSLLPPDAADTNQHVFYRLATVAAVAGKIADELATADPDNGELYHRNAKTFEKQIDSLRTRQATIGAKRPAGSTGIAIVSTEPVAHYLVTDSGLTDLTPQPFAQAAQNDIDPSPSDLAAMLDLIGSGRVSALLFNPQTAGPVANRVKQDAQDHHLPVVTVTETLPEGTDYLSWQRQTIDQLAAAVGP